ncbi:hypothetical protein JRO89_XS07G0064000 [Xanthoceras sorbifolium]|uniref:BRI1 kinase inhibitor 1-like n=1 Tax=Xanthoceras sorbifolium TaxID=99658 RepID=A0ABQ8HSS7_9ROSI|nr:hypothetical protein JRO89_XS07G0064000 [Xanthoceras sorbifolium]
METNQQQTTRDKVVDKRLLQEGNSKLKQEGFGASKQQQQQQQSATAPASPPSSSSSPSHEFSFTISLHSSSTPVPPDKTNKTPPSFAIDLSPADDIFFHGHLLPLHLLSHLPVSPRSSTNSLDSFTLPIRELIDDQKSNLSFRNKQDLRGRRGQFSAPASIRTSPTNSGLLLATTTTLPSSTSDSTMEELQAAIQAAIAHCKNSIAVPVEEKLKC